MEIRQSTYDANVFFLGGYQDFDDARIEQDIINKFPDVEDWEVAARRSAEASDTNNERDLNVFSALFDEYDGEVEFVRTRTPRD